VVVVQDGGAVVTTLGALEETDTAGPEDLGGWCRPGQMEA
jgi:hypothetical protein